MPLLASSTYTTSGLSAETPIIFGPFEKLLSLNSNPFSKIIPNEESSMDTASKVVGLP